jgi:hypothetical protein
MMNSLTPIASLSENLEQLLRAAQPAKSMDPTGVELSGALEAIKRRSQGLMSFVERYRAVAELPEPDLHPVDLEQLFAGVDRLMSPMLREAGVTYRRHIQPCTPPLLADSNLLEQAIINLIRNAAEAASSLPPTSSSEEMRLAPPAAPIVTATHADNQPPAQIPHRASFPEEKKLKSYFPLPGTGGGQGVGLPATPVTHADRRPPARVSQPTSFPKEKNINNDLPLPDTERAGLSAAEIVTVTADSWLPAQVPQQASFPEEKKLKGYFPLPGTGGGQGVGLPAAPAQQAEPTVTVTCEIRDNEWTIAIADNGPGLTEQQRERIFVPFYTTKPNGSGIGLSLARQIAFAHGGRIEVQSNEPTGSVFSIVLPTARAPT